MEINSISMIILVFFPKELSDINSIGKTLNQIFDVFWDKKVCQWNVAQVRVASCFEDGDHRLRVIVECSVEQRRPIGFAQEVHLYHIRRQENRHSSRVPRGGNMQRWSLPIIESIDWSSSFNQCSHTWTRLVIHCSKVESGQLSGKNCKRGV